MIDCVFIVDNTVVLFLVKFSIDGVEDWFGSDLRHFLDLFDWSCINFGERSRHILVKFIIVSVVLSLLWLLRNLSFIVIIFLHQVRIVVDQSLVAWRLSVLRISRSLLLLLLRLFRIVNVSTVIEKCLLRSGLLILFSLSIHKFLLFLHHSIFSLLIVKVHLGIVQILIGKFLRLSVFQESLTLNHSLWW